MIRIDSISKSFSSPDGRVQALKNVSLTLEAGQLMVKIEQCEAVNKIQWQKLSELRAEVGILESQVKLNETVIGMRHE